MPNQLFCERLRTLRRQAHLTQEMVAKEMRIHRSTYTKYECGVVAPDQQGLVLLAQLFGVTVDYLLGNDDSRVASLSDDNNALLELSLEEQQLVQMFRQLPPTEQKALLQKTKTTFKQYKK